MQEKTISGVIYILTLILILTCCNSGTEKSKGYYLTGTITGIKNQKIYLYEKISNQLVIMDSSIINANGFFKIEGKVSEPIRCAIRTEDYNYMPIFFILDNKPIEIKADVNKIENYLISGSKDSELLKWVQNHKNKDEIKNFIDTSFSLVSIFASYSFDINQNYDYLKGLVTKFQERFPNSKYTTEFTKTILETTPILVGATAPDIKLPNPSGDTLRLSSLKGKIVLLDFWASWCGPCRIKNPEIIEMYNKYKTTAFTVFSVSLDKNKNQWLKAIQEDSLEWGNHVSELRGWNTAVLKAYNIKSLPSSFLIDRKGKIIGINSNRQELEKIIPKL